MSRTARVPLRVDARGGIVTTTDPTEQAVIAELLPTGPLTAWDIRDGLEVPSFVWEPNDAQAAARREAHVRRGFDRLEAQGRARLLSIDSRSGPSGQAVTVIIWDNLETGQTGVETVLPSEVG